MKTIYECKVLVCIAAAAMMASTCPAGAGLQDGLLAHYGFDTPNITMDSSTNKRHGVNYGASQSTDDAVSGGAARFDGKGRMVVNWFKKYDWGNSFALSVWMQRMGGWDQFASVVNCGYWEQGSFEVRFTRREQGQIFFGGICTYSDPNPGDISNLKAAPFEWSHFVMCYDGTNLWGWLDGEFVAAKGGDRGDMVRSEHPLTLGNNNRGSGHNEPFVGKIDELRLYSRPLTDEEVLALYRQGHPEAQALERPGEAPGGAAAPAVDGMEQGTSASQPLEAPSAAPEPEPKRPAADTSVLKEDSARKTLDRWIRLWKKGDSRTVFRELDELAKERE